MRIRSQASLAISTAAALLSLNMLSTMPAQAQSGAKVTGTVSYLERIALPDNAVITVQLADVSRLDVAATVLAEQKITSGGKQPPFAFELAYDPAKIDDRFNYAVQATIEVDGKLMFRNDQAYLVITQGRPTTIDLMLRMVADGGMAPTASAPITLPVEPTATATAAETASPNAGGGTGSTPGTAQPAALPTTGGADGLPLLVALGVLALLAGCLLVRARAKQRA
ncbi:MAG: YbaY family lipoprotein [Roseiflexaceae bacterium]|nr:YbaY family lipoprotein [Roseiflexaceae bacterium]